MNQQNKIKIKAFRNAIYQGYVIDDKFDKIGAILDEDYFYCLSNWNNGCIQGSLLAIYSDQKIFYGKFRDGYPQGLCCYQIGNQCQMYCRFGNKAMDRHLVGVFLNIKTILDFYVGESEEIIYVNQYLWKSQKQRWEIIQKILEIKIQQSYYKFNKFIQHQFLPFCDGLEQLQGEQYFFGFKNQGLGIKVNYESKRITSIGYYDCNGMLTRMGKKVINREKGVRQQGIYLKPETLIRYQTRPQKIQKLYRDELRLSIDFNNKFLRLPIIQRIFLQFNKITMTIKKSASNRIAQQLIQHLQQQQIPSPKTPAQKQWKQFSIHRNYNTNDRDTIHGGIMKPAVSLEELKLQLEKSKSKKKIKLSPYHSHDLSPAELKYKTKILPNYDLPIPTTTSSHIPYTPTTYNKQYSSSALPKSSTKRRFLPQKLDDNNTDSTIKDYKYAKPMNQKIIPPPIKTPNKNIYQNHNPQQYNNQLLPKRIYQGHPQDNPYNNNRYSPLINPTKDNNPRLPYNSNPYSPTKTPPKNTNPYYSTKTPPKNINHKSPYSPRHSPINSPVNTQLNKLQKLYDEMQAKQQEKYREQQKYKPIYGDGYRFLDNQKNDYREPYKGIGDKKYSPIGKPSQRMNKNNKKNQKEYYDPYRRATTDGWQRS